MAAKIDRSQELLADVSEHFQGKTKIMNVSWTAEKDVRPDELEDVSGLASRVLRGFLTLPPKSQKSIIFAGRNSSSFSKV